MTGGRNLTSLMLILASWIVMRVGFAGGSAADEPIAPARTVERQVPLVEALIVNKQAKPAPIPLAAMPRVPSESGIRSVSVRQLAPVRLARRGLTIASLQTRSALPLLTSPALATPVQTDSFETAAVQRLVPPANPARKRSFQMTGSYWSVLRAESGSATLAGKGELGGSQAGFRLSAPLGQTLSGGPIALSLRGYSPLARTLGKEAALGISWSHPARLPVELIVERRIGLDRGGRDAVAAMLAGGFGPSPVARGWVAQGYAQAGMVGLRQRDGFADGHISVSREMILPVLGKAQIGGGIWAGAQPKVHRVDVGPQLGIPLNIGAASSRISTEWRFQLTGNSRPSSGPSLTVSGSF